MKLFEHKQQELQRISAEIHRLSQGNPQQQRKCVRLKEDYERLMQEIQKLQENQNKDKIRLDELRKQIEQIEASEENEESKKRKRKKLEKEYEELRKKLDVGEEFKENAEKINGSNGSNENTFSFKSAENIYLNEQHPEVKPVQKDQYGVYEQIRNIKTIEERMLKRKKIESEAEDTFTIRTANLCELEADIDNVRKRMASPVIQKFEEELKFIRKKSSKDTKMLKKEITELERRIDKINRTREICVTAIAEMNLTTKRMLFDLMGFVVNILRNVLYIIAWIRDLLIYYTENI